MPFNLQSALVQQRWNDYSSIGIVTAVSYDYCLTFSNEVTYIWNTPWTWVSTLFIIIRYGGIAFNLTMSLYGSSFMSGSEKVQSGSAVFLSTIHAIAKNILNNIRREIIYIAGTWLYPLFWACADMVIILRVYVMYSQSKIVLGVLLVMYITRVLLVLVNTVTDDFLKYVAVTTVRLLDTSVCDLAINRVTWINASMIAQCILGFTMWILVMARFARESFQLYKGRNWQLNRYVGLIAKESLLYFTFTLFWNVVSVLGMASPIPNGLPTLLLQVMTMLLVFVLTPRFVMNMRELYARDADGRINTGFSLPCGAGRGVGMSTTLGTVVFAEGVENSGLDDGGEIA